MTSAQPVIAGHHDWHIVVLSVIMSLIAAYTARDLVVRATAARRDSLWVTWVSVGAMVDAVGVWSMHYTGMFGLHIPGRVSMDWPTVLLSLLVGFVGSAAAIAVIGRRPVAGPRVLLASVLLGGVAISGLHYTSMRAIRVPVEHHCSVPMVVLSVLVAVGMSFAAIWLAFGAEPEVADRPSRFHSSVLVRGLTNPVMHYTAMAGFTFTTSEMAPDLSHVVGIFPLGILALIISPVVVLLVALLTHLLDRVQKHDILLNELFEQSPLAVSLSSIPDYRVVRVNREFTNLFGYSQQEIEGTPLRDVIVPDNVLAEEKHYLDDLAQDQRVEGETVRRRADGKLVDVSIVGVPVTLPTGEKQVYAIYTDLTERKRADEEIRQTQKLESIGRLAGGIAHDFNNLLTVITGYTELVMSDLGRGHPVCNAVEQISKAAARASALTNQLLLFTRRQTSGREPVLLNDRVRNVDKMLSRLLGEDIAVTLSLEADPGVIQANASQIEQILLNLALNSRDAMPNGGRLVIETANVWLDEQFARTYLNTGPGPYVQLTVSDTGTGMTPDVKARIFEPFFTTKEQGKGTGLGLATAYGIIKQHEGTVLVYSEPGQGSTFRIFFPAARAAAVQAHDDTSRRDLTGTETILVVEDEPGVRRYVADLLERHGYHVLQASNGREALEVSRDAAGRIDLLLTDVVMPEMGGLDLAGRFAQERPGVPVLYMSGYSDRLWRQNMEAQSIQKPFASVTLLTRVREVLTTV